MATKTLGRPKKLTRAVYEKIFKLAAWGMTDPQIAEIVDLHPDTIADAKKDAAFSEALKGIKDKADLAVINSLYKRAIGYEYTEITYEKSKVGGLSMKLLKKSEEEEIGIESVGHTDTHIQKITKKHMAPDVTACIFWLKNRQRKDWREKVGEEGEKGDTHYHLTLQSPPPAPGEKVVGNRVSELTL